MPFCLIAPDVGSGCRIGRAFFAVRRDSDAWENESVTVLIVGWAEAHQSTTENEETVG
ncbi:hypothetical protein [Neisseria benedictiae]|uniref:hypothetical protein n=1 Tax=Neisseria benedictiae TaxID=2830649 RepID=UPI00272A0317|nr:hypothetical protein [Neisseria benedictiae]